ncbi:DNA-binding beta-propeller fold protein YncE [Haloferula luteola]|uniref:DNA-binding beta-propeller fold protein YncE n=1 Tax=Haloferula luteola TaxID=595692 RepID=A0A840V1D5_9BACT|nr:YncE family protein [Haloferula luteola]MBB5351812.1 DNA-binding beta-propeller fold protein YncE [Haloferula luteola]
MEAIRFRGASPSKAMLLRQILFCLVLSLAARGFTQFEARQQHPVELTPNGRRLLALNSTTHTLSVFDVGSPPRATPLLIAEIPVSTAPVTVRARTDDEAWVIHELSDSISVISLSQGIIIDTLRVPDEPADLVFAGGKAFVSCSRNARVVAFDATTRVPIGELPVDGLLPRALAVSADGSQLYVASLLSGNRTTILAPSLAPAPPAPTDPELPAAPQTGLIVSADDSRVSWTVLDHDIAVVDTSTLTLQRWISGVGTHLFSLAVHPDGSLWCANTEALNLTRFEPELNGEFARHRLSRIDLTNDIVTSYDLNPGLVRRTSPDPTSIALALAQPTDLVFNSDGSRCWLAAFNSDRVAEFETATGSILRRIDVRPAGLGAEGMRGPRGLALGEGRLYVLNKISDTLVTVDTLSGDLLSETGIGTYDPMPPDLRRGRGVLYDARLSGNGTISCATCHLDADRDGLAWDLGDPGGSMVEVIGGDLSAHDFTLVNRQLHPMKGPLLTQTLRGLSLNDAKSTDPTDGSTRPAAAITTKFHWRGDKPSIQSFNPTFPHLMGGVLQSDETMDDLASYLMSILLHPNPHRNLDRSLRSDLPAGDATKGLTVFNDHLLSHCIVCHDYNAGTDQNLDFAPSVGRLQPIKNPPLRLVHQRAGQFDPTAGAQSLAGFGLGPDGSGSVLPIVHPYSLDQLDKPPMTAAKRANLANLKAFILSYDTGTAPVVGYDLTLNSQRRSSADLLTQLALLETQAGYEWNGLVAWGRVGGIKQSFRWDPDSSTYVSPGHPLDRAALLDLLQPGDALTFSGIPLEELHRRSDDRNGNGVVDSDEKAPVPFLLRDAGNLSLKWTGIDWFPESSGSLDGPWLPAPGEATQQNLESILPIDRTGSRRHFYRLRRTW